MRDLYLIKILENFYNLRQKNSEIYFNMFSRIRDTFFPITNNKKKIEISTYKFNKIFFFFKIIFKFKKYFKQINYINNSKKKLLFIGISNRFIDYDSSLEDLIINNSTVLGAKENKLKQITEAIYGNDLILLFDSEMSSKFWNYLNYNEKRFLIIDGNFLLFIFICSFLKNSFLITKKNSFYVFFNNILHFRNISKIRIPLLNTIFMYIIDRSITSISKNSSNYDLITFTSNNFLTEVLRANSVLNQNCKSVIEITHGALTYPVFEFYQNIYNYELEITKKSISKQKMSHFIPNLPNPPSEFNIDIYPQKLCLNAQLVSRYLERKNFFKGKNNYINYLQSMTSNSKKIVSIFGGTGLGGNFYESFEYDLEIYIIDLLINKFKSFNQDIEILYKCHPANSIYNDEKLEILKSKNIKIVDYAIDCFLISDYFYSTVSSSLFEMQWLNGSVITPIIINDKIYSEEYLNLIFYPKDDKLSSFDDALNKFIQSKIDSQYDASNRVRERIEMILGK